MKISEHRVLELTQRVTILAGGTGSVKLVRGLASQGLNLNVVCNVGDNYWLYGMYVCPDIDTIIYGLADLLDYDRGWGIKNDTFNFLRQMEVFGEETWFRIGDRDAATHLIRTNMLKNGKNLSDITEWMCEKFAVTVKIIPVTDNSVETRITTSKGELHLQEFWVKHRGKDKVEGIQYIGADKARPNPQAVNAIHDSDLVILAPGNPLTSIGPMLQIKGIRKELSKMKKKVVAISPLIGDKAISGPAAQYMEAAGIDVNAYGLAKMYSDVCSNIVIDTKDKSIAKKIQNLDMKIYDTKITMKNQQAEDALASFIVKQVRV
ncbi:MAG: 2-phospho-L-lactate transferase [Nitrosopumilales archaeon]|nr:MAG: 2-phospho-L-lactate transferase [Nitrosopumilales archaeon]